MTRRSKSTLLAAALLTGSLALTACGGGGESAGAAEGDVPPFSVAMPGSPGVSFLPLLAAIDTLRDEEGYEIDVHWIPESELTVEGTASGEFELSSGTSHSTMLAMLQGAPIKWFGDRVRNEWTIYGTSDISTCEDLEGRRLAIHSEGAISTAMIRVWMAENCPGTAPEEVVISGSPNRFQALVGGQIDASPLELADAIQLEARDEVYNRLTSFSQDLPQLKTTTYFGNEAFMTEHPQVVESLLKAILEENRKISDDPAHLAGLIETYLDDFDPALVETVAQQYSELGLFPENGTLDPDEVQFTIDTFVDGGIIDEGLTPEDVVDSSFLENVLEDIGGR